MVTTVPRGVVKRNKLLEIDTINRYEAAISCANIGNDHTLFSIPFLSPFYSSKYTIFVLKETIVLRDSYRRLSKENDTVRSVH